jgi:hypothetical protein
MIANQIECTQNERRGKCETTCSLASKVLFCSVFFALFSHMTTFSFFLYNDVQCGIVVNFSFFVFNSLQSTRD